MWEWGRAGKRREVVCECVCWSTASPMGTYQTSISVSHESIQICRSYIASHVRCRVLHVLQSLACSFFKTLFTISNNLMKLNRGFHPKSAQFCGVLRLLTVFLLIRVFSVFPCCRSCQHFPCSAQADFHSSSCLFFPPLGDDIFSLCLFVYTDVWRLKLSLTCQIHRLLFRAIEMKKIWQCVTMNQ